jgi:hypothetical protein
VNVETKEHSKQWVHTHSPNKPNILNKRCLPESLWQLFSGTGQERSAGDVIHATRDHNNITSVLRNTKIAAQGHPEEKAWNADIRSSASPRQCASAYEYSCFPSLEPSPRLTTAFQLWRNQNPVVCNFRYVGESKAVNYPTCKCNCLHFCRPLHATTHFLNIKLIPDFRLSR